MFLDMLQRKKTVLNEMHSVEYAIGCHASSACSLLRHVLCRLILKFNAPIESFGVSCCSKSASTEGLTVPCMTKWRWFHVSWIEHKLITWAFLSLLTCIRPFSSIEHGVR
ncbi:hypothetical protein HETIRDRAFT_416519 [Heterobasidion irregulare TC 32-1]|uniref:Uncharacterized protein n=1 Tax=Heterobasidion irregulare (strain TC 32-1) TaxID=747525 RepID=W4KIP5_HETIT|nr:uncharacterized protein HETIRDRAFT_416519 [Heterobasidion irregulare TC 32-1]ETW84921.1 hypothetical protein HETIRDRAFT_416519 [Heterobasidion irregulare TC 32-1]